MTNRKDDRETAGLEATVRVPICPAAKLSRGPEVPNQTNDLDRADAALCYSIFIPARVDRRPHDQLSRN
jgi:hypothetical protein